MPTRNTVRFVALTALSVAALSLSSCGGTTKSTAAAPAAEAEQKLYAIKLDRKLRPGVRETSVSKEVNSMEMSMGEQIIQSQESEVQKEFVAVAKTLEWDENGDLARGEYLVEKLLIVQDGQESVLIVAPILVSATRVDNVTHLVSKGGALSEQAREVLSDFISVSKKESQAGDDDVFGNKKPQAVGAEWPMNAELALSDGAVSGLPFVPGTLSGNSKVESIRTVDEEECLEIKGQFHGQIDAAKMFSDLPPQATMQAEAGATFFGLFPVNAAKHEVERGMTMDLSLLAAFEKDGQKMNMKTISHMEKITQYSYEQ